MTDQTYSLYHLDSKTVVTFRPISAGHLKGQVGVTESCQTTKAFTSMTVSVADARRRWTAWKTLGAYDLRKHTVLGGDVYRREADGTVSIRAIQSRFDRDDHKDDFCPKGYRFVRCEWLDRDDEMDHNEEYVAYHYAPVEADLLRTPDGCVDWAAYENLSKSFV